jgi:hypothetical protein
MEVDENSFIDEHCVFGTRVYFLELFRACVFVMEGSVDWLKCAVCVLQAGAV